jgi:hypothetical protein
MRLLLTFFFFGNLLLYGQQMLVQYGAQFRFFDQGQAPASWNQPSFNDASWAYGNAQFGYGDGDESTVVSYGGSSSNKHMTTYFRHTFQVTDPSVYTSLTANLLRDDGAVVYLNGVEVWRSNMPSGTIGFNTPSDGTVSWPFEDDWYAADFSATYLQPGNNVLAVEIHQDEPSSSDISFDFSLFGNQSENLAVVRGPYLQKANQSSIILRWRTDNASDSKVRYGISPGNLNNVVALPQFVNDHQIQLSGLNPNTVYYYSIGSNSTVLAQGPNHYFKTLPLTGEEDVYEFLVLGDAGTGYQEQLDAKNAAITYNGSTHFDGVLLLGDNAYQSGFDDEYQDNFFDNKYNEIFQNTVIWPAPGNHDYNNHIPFSPSPAYFDIFNCPTSGECGGVPSGTEKYYSFNYGNIHFVSLDSYDVPRSVDGAMATWINQDLAANTLPWIVVYFHHPPYTKGSHDSDNTFFLDGELVDMRENIMPILENYGVDLILSGHSHSYERSFLIDGHYGDSDSFGPQHMKDGSGGNYPQDCPYVKSTDAGAGHQGAVYTVMGCSGKISSVQSDWPHPAMYSYTAEKVGTMFIKVERNRMDAVFLTKEGAEFDKFSIVKDVGITQTVYTCFDEPVTMTNSWPENVVWSPGGFVGESYTVNAFSNATVTATDPLNCIEDVFNIVVVDHDSCSSLGIQNDLIQTNLPSILLSNKKLMISFDQSIEYEIFNTSGRRVHRFKADKPEHTEDLSFLNSGIYFLKPRQFDTTFKIYIND